LNYTNQLVIFSLDEQRFALHLSAVERIVRIVEITPLPKALVFIQGIINFQSQILPVINMRKQFCLPERKINLSNQLIIANTPKRTIALLVDSVGDIVECSEEEIVKAEKVIAGIEYVKGMIKLEDGIVLLHDLEKLLSVAESKNLEKALQKQTSEKKENKRAKTKNKQETPVKSVQKQEFINEKRLRIPRNNRNNNKTDKRKK